MRADAIVKNRSELTTSVLRRQALDILEAGIASVLPAVVMRSSLTYDKAKRTLVVQRSSFDVSKGRLFVIGGGKASGLMVESLEDILGPQSITAGIVTVKDGTEEYHTKKVQIAPASHPVPDERGLKATKSMLDLKAELSIGEEDTIICLISGGGSALLPCPVEEISLEEEQKTTGLLLASGADIGEINSVRKHLSRTKGGRLGRYFAPATVISLILSDVIGNDLSVIASGPTYPDSSTFADALSVLEKYYLLSKLPSNVVSYLQSGVRGALEDTVKSLDNCHNFIIGDNSLALDAMKHKAEKLGLRPCIVTSEQRGETGAAARLRADEILREQYSNCDAILIGGETTPTLPDGAGKGGRNQHYAAVSMIALKGCSGAWVVASVGTDGSDFLPDVAGAIVDNDSISMLAGRGVDPAAYVDKYDSYSLLKILGNSLVVTGNTGTNVGDIIVYILKKSQRS